MTQDRATSERIVETATRLAGAMRFALPKLPNGLQVALNARVDDGDALWGLALVLAGWRLADRSETKAAEVQGLMAEMGVKPLLEDVSAFSLALPPSFTTFVASARSADADYKLAGAGAYLTEAIGSLGASDREMLQNWMRSPQFYEAARALIRRFPLPGSGRPPVWGSPPDDATAPSRPIAPNRAQRFDRQDFRVRPSTKAGPPSPTSVAPQPRNATPPQSLSVPSPDLDEEALTEAYLRLIGYSETDIQRLMAGPETRR